MRTNFGDHERLDFSGVGDVGTNTQVDHGSATVYGCSRPIGNFGLNKIPFVFIILQTHLRHGCERSGNRDSLLTWNISSNFVFETSRRSNFCRSLMALSAIFSSRG